MDQQTDSLLAKQATLASESMNQKSDRQKMNDTFCQEGWKKIQKIQKPFISESLSQSNCFANITRQQILKQNLDKQPGQFGQSISNFPVLNNSNSRPLNEISNLRISQQSFQVKKDKSVVAPKQQKTNRHESKNRYLSVGFNEEKGEMRSNSNANAFGSRGISTNEDTQNSYGAFKKSDESSMAEISSELQTKVSNEAGEKDGF